MIKTFMAWPRLRDPERAGAYARRAIVTTAIDWRRRRSFHERPVEVTPKGPGTDEEEGVVTHQVLIAQLRGLPPRQRAAIVLRFYEDLSVIQTAEIMGCSAGSVKSHVSIGLRRPRERMGPEFALHMVDPDSGHDQVLGRFPKVEAGTWAWSPDGSRLVYSDGDGRAQLFDRASGTTLPVRPRLHGHQLPIWELTWSPQGRRLLGTAAATDPSTALFALISMDPDGSSVKVVTPWTQALYSSAATSWSPR